MATMEIGDIVLVCLHTHKQDKGTICHITDDNALFITTEKQQRVRITFNNIAQSIQIIAEADENEQHDLLSAPEIQTYITNNTFDNGTNYHVIGRNYESGLHGFPIDFDKAMFWYDSGHELNVLSCTIQLAQISAEYYHDYVAAENYWNIGINLGDAYCAYEASIMFRMIANDREKELYYIKKHIELTNGEHSGSLLDFAVCQLTMDVPDYDESYHYLIKAFNVDKRSIGVQQFLAIVVFRGLGCEKDEEKAILMHQKLVDDYRSECSMLWMSVYRTMHHCEVNNVHPLADKIYQSFMNVIDNGDSHGLFYGNWIKIIEYLAFQRNDDDHDMLSCCLFVALKIFGILECEISIKDAKKCICSLMDVDTECPWIRSWIWFFTERYEIIKRISQLPDGLIDVVTELELSIFLANGT
eukprot:145346_1